MFEQSRTRVAHDGYGRGATTAGRRAGAALMEKRAIVIVGAGPAGTASALFLHRMDPAMAAETLVLDKAHHPRMKVCAGGLIPHTLDCLRELDVQLAVPHAVVERARVAVPGRVVHYDGGEELCRVVRRDAFDASLVHACRSRGVEVREGEKVLELRRDGDEVRVETTRETYQARLVVGADGSGSIVRRQLVAPAPAHVGRAIMCDVPLAHCRWSGFDVQRYDFDFAAVRRGLRGYLWAFPCWIDAIPHVNVGVYSVEAHDRGRQMAELLDGMLAAIGCDWPVPRQAFPIRWYGREAKVAAPRVLLAGDAAGVDPLMGEGISFAFEYGRRVAAAAKTLAQGTDPSQAYAADVHASWMGKKLRRLEMATRLFYGPTWRLWFGVAACSRQAREIGLRWYNGVDGWDRRSGWDALRAWWQGSAAPAHS
jgi:flavin-dependent dehydrogenase